MALGTGTVFDRLQSLATKAWDDGMCPLAQCGDNSGDRMELPRPLPSLDGTPNPLGLTLPVLQCGGAE